MAELIGQMNLRVLKEPLGFIRVIQFPMVILAFSTTAGYSAALHVAYKCEQQPSAVDQSYLLSWHYPFDLANYAVPTDLCKAVDSRFALFAEGAVSQSQFYVCTGILSFLYILAILAVYLFQLEKYETDSRYPMLDFVVTGVLAFFWFVSCCAWASGVTAIKAITDHDHVKKTFLQNVVTCKAPSGGCLLTTDWNFGALNVSLIAGFACVFLFASNLWFVWKETEWFKSRQTQNVGMGGGSIPSSASGMPTYSGPQ